MVKVSCQIFVPVKFLNFAYGPQLYLKNSHLYWFESKRITKNLVGIDLQEDLTHGVITYVILVAYVVSTPFQSVLPPNGLFGGKPQFTSEAMK